MRSPRLYLAASPTASASIPDIFRSNEVRLVLENPHFTRHNGFNLVTYERAKIDKGERLTISTAKGRKRLDLYRDGTFVVYARFPDFLGWPRDADEFANDPKINPLAFIEFVYDFAVNYERILDFVEPPAPPVRFVIGMRDAVQKNGRPIYMAPYGLGQIGFEAPHELNRAPAAQVDLSFETNTSEQKPHFSPGTVAYELVESLYNWFGFESGVIPYTDEARIEIDPEKITAA